MDGGNLRPAPDWLSAPRVDRLLRALDDRDAAQLLRPLGLSDDEIASLSRLGNEIGCDTVSAAREIIRCSIAVMEGRH